MYRGSAFISKHRASIFNSLIKDFIKEFSLKDFNRIYDPERVETLDDLEEKIDLIINKNMQQCGPCGKKCNRVSSLLVTKIMLGIFCLVPAYDENVKAAIGNIIESNENIKISSKPKLFRYIIKLCLEDKTLSSKLKSVSPFFDCSSQSKQRYPIIRTLDLILWHQAGRKIC